MFNPATPECQYAYFTTAQGNTLQLFYNNTTGLVVLDLIAENEGGGHEFVRLHIDEDNTLDFLRQE